MLKADYDEALFRQKIKEVQKEWNQLFDADHHIIAEAFDRTIGAELVTKYAFEDPDGYQEIISDLYLTIQKERRNAQSR